MSGFKMFTFIILSLPLMASAKNYPGCSDLRMSINLLEMVPNSSQEELQNLREARKALCSKFTPRAGSSVSYPNGRKATYHARQEGVSWYYPNGRLITSYAGQAGAAWYYSNGKLISSYMGQKGEAIYYPNSRSATQNAYEIDASWFYENGRKITSHAGKIGATWFYPNGQVISYDMGKEGAAIYRPDGTVLNSNGPAIAEEELLQVPKIISNLMKDLR